MTRLVARVYDTAIRALSRLAIGWTPHTHWDHDPLYDPGRELDDRPPLDPRDVDLWGRQFMAADTDTILREANR